LFGYLTCKPFNSGSSFELKLLYEDVHKDHINLLRECAEKHELGSSLILNSHIEIWNKNKINVSSGLVLERFVHFVKEVSTLDIK
jgi:hypothetical protein